MITSQASRDSWEFIRRWGNSEELKRTKARGMGSVPAERNQPDGSQCQGKQLRRARTSWYQKNRHNGGPAANLELQRSEESELTSPADQLGSDQRADGIILLSLKLPSEPEPGLHSWCQWHTKEASDELSPGNPSSGLNEEAVLETAWKTISKYHS